MLNFLNFFESLVTLICYFCYKCEFILLSVSILIPLLLSIAIYTLAERKWMASVQRRKGPNVVGIWGFLQPFADGLKLILKEILVPTKANRAVFIGSPAVTLFFSLIGWISFAFNSYCVLNMNCSIMYLLVCSSFGVYGIILASWSSNSKYSYLGMFRSLAQMISYEITIGFCVMFNVLLSGSLCLDFIIYLQTQTVWFIFPLFPVSIIFFISILAETNRTPFDLSEAEAELVAGYNTEYSSIVFAFFFLGEFFSIIFMFSLFTSFFLAGGSVPIFSNYIKLLVLHKGTFLFLYNFMFAFKTVLVMFFFVFIRANLPRYRFRDLMFINWKNLFPLILGLFFFYIGILWALDSFLISSIPRLTWKYYTIIGLSTRF